MTELPVYLDNAATTPLDARVAKRMAEVLSSESSFGNPSSSTHRFGEEAAALVAAARQQVAAAVGATPEEVVFTSGATEANNLAILGVARYYEAHGRHLITARTEHKSVLDPCAELERRGWKVTYLSPAADGRIEPEQLEAALRPDTVLVSLMQVNNEIGVLQDIAALARVCRAHVQARLHVDAAQAVGKSSVDFAAVGADLMSLSAHKAYGPKGVGALLIRQRADARRVHLTPLQFGGGQEQGLRSGTSATHQIVGMGLAFELSADLLAAETLRLEGLRERLWQGLAAIGGVLRNGVAQRSVPNLLNVSFEGVEGESLLAAVDQRIAVSTGSACTSAMREPSYVLKALGRSDQLCESSLRFGLGPFTVARDIEVAIETVREAVLRLRRVAGTES